MSDEIKKAYKDLLNSKPAKTSQQASKSLLDEVVEDVDVGRHRKKFQCPSCSSKEYDVRGGLNSRVRIYQCKKCGTKIERRKRRINDEFSAPKHAQGRGGCYYKPPGSAEHSSPHTPKFKRKSKPRPEE